jgi:DNA-binding transcriptional regulator GbsR (MarR family)
MEVGKFIRYWGFKTIHGRIWTHLYLSDQPLDAGMLMRRLKVSKALMSLSLNDLLQYQVIKESGKSARGTTVYIANPRVLDVIMNVLNNREKKMLGEIEVASSKISDLLGEKLKEHSICNKKLNALGFMVKQAQNVLNGLLTVSSVNLAALEVFNDYQKIGQ